VALADVADELYGLLPGDFVGARDARARELRSSGDRDGAKAVAGLRKPTVAGWLVNAVVRRHREDVELLLSLGDDLRRAQSGLDGGTLRTLATQRQKGLAAVTRQASALARELGQPVSPAVLDEVTSTFGAALADPDAAEQVRAGRVTGALSYAGLGGFGAAPQLRVVRPAPAQVDDPDRADADEAGARFTAEEQADAERVGEAQRAAEEAQRFADEAEQAADQARQAVDDAQRAADDARQAEEDAQRAWEEAQRVWEESQRARGEAQRSLAAARRDAGDAQQALESARQALADARAAAART